MLEKHTHEQHTHEHTHKHRPLVTTGTNTGTLINQEVYSNDMCLFSWNVPLRLLSHHKIQAISTELPNSCINKHYCLLSLLLHRNSINQHCLWLLQVQASASWIKNILISDNQISTYSAETQNDHLQKEERFI